MTTNSGSNIPTGASGTLLQGSGVGTNSVFTTATYPATTTISQLLYSSSNNVVAGLTTANNGTLVTSNTGVPSILAGGSAGQVLTANTGAAPSWQSVAGGIAWVDSVATPVTTAVNTGYIADNGASQTVFNLPATVAVGSVFQFMGKGSGGWTVVANTGQTIHLGSSVTSSGGSLTSTNQYDSLSIVCITANTVYGVLSAVGNLTVA